MSDKIQEWIDACDYQGTLEGVSGLDEFAATFKELSAWLNANQDTVATIADLTTRLEKTQSDLSDEILAKLDIETKWLKRGEQIADLTAQLAEAKQELNDADHYRKSIGIETESQRNTLRLLRSQQKEDFDRAETAEAKLSALEAVCGELRGALEPFAGATPTYDGEDDMKMVDLWCYVKDFRAARRALSHTQVYPSMGQTGTEAK